MSKQTILASAANITSNYLPRYNGTGYVNSVIYDNGTNVGIGTSSPNYSGLVSGISVLTIAPTASERWGALELVGNRTAGENQVGSLYFTNINTTNTPIALIQAVNGVSSVSQGSMLFYTNGGSLTERMRITSGGTLQQNIPTGGLLYNAQDATFTGYVYKQIVNAGGSFYIGLERSTGSGLCNNAPAYATVLTTTNATSLSFGTNVTERMRIASDGTIGIARTNASDTRLIMKGIGNSSATYALTVQNGSSVNMFYLRDDNVLFAPSIYSNTYSNASNVYVGADGAVGRSTSSLKYKENIIDYSKGLSEVMQLRPVSYTSKNPQEKGQTFAGLIAEEVEELGLKEFVQYAEDGTPDSLAYTQMIALLTKAIQELSAKVTDQQQQINQLINK